MSQAILQTIKNILNEFQEPNLGVSLQEAGVIRSIVVEGDQVKIEIMLGFAAKLYSQQFAEQLKQIIQEKTNIKQINININWQILPHAVQPAVPSIPHIKNIIAVASGKGGVGKSTTAVNIALALNAEGAKVGILDADIYGPNQPQMLGIQHKAEVSAAKHFKPIESHGIQSMSIGYLVDTNTPMIWRGPMVTTALMQLLRDTEWDHLDYLIIDLPPGTGDIQLTLAQKIPVSGAVIVTTPQDIALLDARKGLEMFKKVHVPVLGIVENMSGHICSACGHREAIFGEGGGERLAKAGNIPLLGQIPLSMQVREQADGGTPTVVSDPLGEIAKYYFEIARKLVARLSLQPKNLSAKFPKIVVEK